MGRWSYLSVLARVGSRRHGQLVEVPSIAPAMDVYSIISNALSVCYPLLFNPRPALHVHALCKHAAAFSARVQHRLQHKAATDVRAADFDYTAVFQHMQGCKIAFFLNNRKSQMIARQYGQSDGQKSSQSLPWAAWGLHWRSSWRQHHQGHRSYHSSGLLCQWAGSGLANRDPSHP